MNHGRGPAGPEALLPHKLRDILCYPVTDLDVVSAYFVPTAAGIEAFVALAQRITTAFRSAIPADAYEVRLSETGDLYWIERREEGLVRHATEPGATLWRRIGVWVISLLPIEGLL